MNYKCLSKKRLSSSQILGKLSGKLVHFRFRTNTREDFRANSIVYCRPWLIQLKALCQVPGYISSPSLLHPFPVNTYVRLIKGTVSRNNFRRLCKSNQHRLSAYALMVFSSFYEINLLDKKTMMDQSFVQFPPSCDSITMFM